MSEKKHAHTDTQTHTHTHTQKDEGFLAANLDICVKITQQHTYTHTHIKRQETPAWNCLGALAQMEQRNEALMALIVPLRLTFKHRGYFLDSAYAHKHTRAHIPHINTYKHTHTHTHTHTRTHTHPPYKHRCRCRCALLCVGMWSPVVVCMH